MKRMSDVEALMSLLVRGHWPGFSIPRRDAEAIIRFLKRRGWRKGKVLARGWVHPGLKRSLCDSNIAWVYYRQPAEKAVPVDVVERVK